MSSSIKAGKYEARINDADVWSSKNGDPTVVLNFEFKDETQNPRSLMWFGSLNGGAKPITIETLVKCGFQGNNLVDLNVKGKAALNEGPYEIVVELHANPNQNNTLQPRIKYINLPGSGGFRDRMTQQDAVKLCQGMNLAADFMEARQKMGKKQPAPQQPQQNSQSGLGSVQDIPF